MIALNGSQDPAGCLRGWKTDSLAAALTRPIVIVSNAQAPDPRAWRLAGT